jgi:hypothetical protein
MTATVGTDNRIGGSPQAATSRGGEVATRPPVVRYAAGNLQRVRAFMRVTRSANGSTCCRSVKAGGSASRPPNGGRRERVALWSDAGGPGPLTEDRKKNRRRLWGAPPRFSPRAWIDCMRAGGTERVTPCLPGRLMLPLLR